MPKRMRPRICTPMPQHRAEAHRAEAAACQGEEIDARRLRRCAARPIHSTWVQGGPKLAQLSSLSSKGRKSTTLVLTRLCRFGTSQVGIKKERFGLNPVARGSASPPHAQKHRIFFFTCMPLSVHSTTFVSIYTYSTCTRTHKHMHISASPYKHPRPSGALFARLP